MIKKILLIISVALINKTYSQSFTCGDTLLDTRDNQKYATVLIGSDCWFKDNLNYGTRIDSDTLSVIHSQQTNNGIPEKYAQNNDPANLLIYGGLYEQAELMNYSSNPQGLCPSGWHVSNDVEWQNMITAAGGVMTSATAGHNANGVKAIGTGVASGVGTDLVGISLMPGGDRDGFGIFYGMGVRYIYWTSTPSGTNTAYHYMFWMENDTIQRFSLGTQTTAFSCRCVQNVSTGLDETSIPNFRLFPNPAGSVVYLENIPVNSELLIYNTMGQLVQNIKTEQHYSTFQLSTIDWPSGIYWIQVKDQEGKLQGAQKFVIK